MHKMKIGGKQLESSHIKENSEGEKAGENFAPIMDIVS